MGPLSLTLPVGLSVLFALHVPALVTTRVAMNPCAGVEDEIAQTCEPLDGTVFREKVPVQSVLL